MKRIILAFLLLLLALPAFAQSNGGPAYGINVSNVTGLLPVANGGTGCTGIFQITTGTSNTYSGTACAIAWDSASTGNKTQNIVACSSGNSGSILTVKDEIGSGAVYPITVTPASGAIDNLASSSINTVNGSKTFVCDGVSNWMTVSQYSPN